MISAAKKVRRTAPAVALMKQLSRLREEMDDLSDYLDLLDARARNADRPRYTTAQIRKKLGL